MAKPIPWASPAMAVLMPMSAPSTSTSAPPLLPGLIAASVWMRSRRDSSWPVPLQVSVTSMRRPMALTTPVVTELVNVPSGLPMAMACWPTLSVPELPMSTAGRSVPSILHDGQVRERIQSVDLTLVLLAVRQLHGQGDRVADHVPVRHHPAVRIEDDAGAHALREGEAAVRAARHDRDHGRADPVHGLRDGALLHDANDVRIGPGVQRWRLVLTAPRRRPGDRAGPLRAGGCRFPARRRSPPRGPR